MKKYCLDGEIAAFDFHDETGFWSFCGPKSMKEFLAELKNGEKAEIEINSPGGSVIAGVEMANAIKNCGAHLIAHVTGMAASMASVIACACDEIILEEASFMMIHDPWTEVEGNAEELRKQASILDQMKEMILAFYRGKFTKCSDEDLAKLMSETTYMTASECVDAGLECSVIKSDVRYAAKLTARDMAKAPEAARAYFHTAEMPEEVKAAIEAAKVAAADAAVVADSATNPGTSAQPLTVDIDATQSTETTSLPSTEVQPKANIESSSTSGENDIKIAEDWQARYKGASKKINELQAKIGELEEKVAAMAVEMVDYGTVVAERDGLKNRVETLSETAAKSVEAEKYFKDQLDKSVQDLADANAKISDLNGKIEKSEQVLVQTHQQLDHLMQTRDLLTGGVLTPTEDTSYAAKMAAAKTPEERESLRAQKRAGKIN